MLGSAFITVVLSWVFHVKLASSIFIVKRLISLSFSFTSSTTLTTSAMTSLYPVTFTFLEATISASPELCNLILCFSLPPNVTLKFTGLSIEVRFMFHSWLRGSIVIDIVTPSTCFFIRITSSLHAGTSSLPIKVPMTVGWLRKSLLAIITWHPFSPGFSGNHILLIASLVMRASLRNIPPSIITATIFVLNTVSIYASLPTSVGIIIYPFIIGGKLLLLILGSPPAISQVLRNISCSKNSQIAAYQQSGCRRMLSVRFPLPSPSVSNRLSPPT